MLRYALRILPLSALIAGTLGAAALLCLVHLRPAQMLQAAGVAAATAGATAPRLFDEPAAALVDTLPRPLRWRTLARLLPTGFLALIWLIGASVIDTQGVGQPDVLRLQGVGTILAAAAVTTVLRRRGQPAPGLAVASTTLLVTSFLVLLNPFDRSLPFFPYGSAGDWAASRRLWTLIAAAAAAALAISCLEGIRWRTVASLRMRPPTRN